MLIIIFLGYETPGTRSWASLTQRQPWKVPVNVSYGWQEVCVCYYRERWGLRGQAIITRSADLPDAFWHGPCGKRITGTGIWWLAKSSVVIVPVLLPTICGLFTVYWWLTDQKSLLSILMPRKEKCCIT